MHAHAHAFTVGSLITQNDFDDFLDLGQSPQANKEKYNY